jgi:hypothetical protein
LAPRRRPHETPNTPIAACPPPKTKAKPQINGFFRRLLERGASPAIDGFDEGYETWESEENAAVYSIPAADSIAQIFEAFVKNARTGN